MKSTSSFCVIGVLLMGATAAVDMYDKNLDHVIEWEAIHESSRGLENGRPFLSQTSGVLLDEIKEVMRTSEDLYFSAAQSVYEWCGDSVPLLERYIVMVNNNAQDNAQQLILLHMLDTGIQKMFAAMERIQQSNVQLQTAAGKLTALGNQLIITIFPVRKYISAAAQQIDTTRFKLKDEIRATGYLKITQEETKVFVGVSVAELKNDTVRSATDSINKCRDYRGRHGRV